MVNVMIVEDQKLVRSILESYIKKEEGYELLSSIPGADRAADICDACRIDLILMDGTCRPSGGKTASPPWRR